MNAEQFNRLYPVGTLVFAYPGFRPEDAADARRLVTRTRTAAQMSASGDPVVWVEGEGSYICLTHVDPVAEDVWEAARAAEKQAERAETPSDPVLKAMATIEKALNQYFEDSPGSRHATVLYMSQAFCSQREAMASAYRDAADLVARYGAGSVEQSLCRDIATELRRRALEAS